MNEQKRFRKQDLNRDDDKGMEQGAKALKGGVGLAGAAALMVKNKDNLKELGRGAVKLLRIVIRK